MREILKERARACKSYAEVDALLHEIEEDSRVSDALYYAVKHIGLESAYRNGATA